MGAELVTAPAISVNRESYSTLSDLWTALGYAFSSSCAHVFPVNGLRWEGAIGLQLRHLTREVQGMSRNPGFAVRFGRFQSTRSGDCAVFPRTPSFLQVMSQLLQDAGTFYSTRARTGLCLPSASQSIPRPGSNDSPHCFSPWYDALLTIQSSS